MNTIALTLRPPGRKPIRLNYTGPSTWSELSQAQWVGVLRVRAGVENRRELLFPCLKLLYGMKAKHQRCLFEPALLAYEGFGPDEREEILEQGQNLLKTIEWIGELDSDAHFPTRFRRFDYYYGTPLVWLRQGLNRTVYGGPSAGLGNCTFEEFMWADRAYTQKNLPLLAAILCRPLQSGERIAFDKKTVEERAKQFNDLDPALLSWIAFAFGCTLLGLQRSFRFVFPKTVEDETTPKKQAGSWLDVAIGMAKFDATKIGEIEQINLYLALKVLNEQMKQAHEMEKQIEKMKNNTK